MIKSHTCIKVNKSLCLIHVTFSRNFKQWEESHHFSLYFHTNFLIQTSKLSSFILRITTLVLINKDMRLSFSLL